MADYCTVAEVKADIPESPLSSSTDYDAALAIMVTDASRLIDAAVGRWPNFFYPSTADETRIYDGNGEYELRIDECLSITTLSVAESGGVESTDYTTWSSTDYYVHPYNYSQLSEPFRKLCVDVWNGSKSYWHPYPRAVKVVGVFGWSTTPPSEINRAAKIQCVRTLMRAKQGYQDAGANEALGQMFFVKELDPDVKALLAKWMIFNGI